MYRITTTQNDEYIVNSLTNCKKAIEFLFNGEKVKVPYLDIHTIETFSASSSRFNCIVQSQTMISH